MSARTLTSPSPTRPLASPFLHTRASVVLGDNLPPYIGNLRTLRPDWHDEHATLTMAALRAHRDQVLLLRPDRFVAAALWPNDPLNVSRTVAAFRAVIDSPHCSPEAAAALAAVHSLPHDDVAHTQLNQAASLSSSVPVNKAASLSTSVPVRAVSCHDPKDDRGSAAVTPLPVDGKLVAPVTTAPSKGEAPSAGNDEIQAALLLQLGRMGEMMREQQTLTRGLQVKLEEQQSTQAQLQRQLRSKEEVPLGALAPSTCVQAPATPRAIGPALVVAIGAIAALAFCERRR